MSASRDVLLQTTEMTDAAEFYRDALGLTVFLRTPSMIGLEAGGICLYLEQAPALGPVFEFFVDDLETAKRDLRQRGCVLLLEDPEVPKCYLRDPFGLTFNIAAKKNNSQADDAEHIRDNEPPPHY